MSGEFEMRTKLDEIVEEEMGEAHGPQITFGAICGRIAESCFRHGVERAQDREQWNPGDPSKVEPAPAEEKCPCGCPPWDCCYKDPATGEVSRDRRKAERRKGLEVAAVLHPRFPERRWWLPSWEKNDLRSIPGYTYRADLDYASCPDRRSGEDMRKK